MASQGVLLLAVSFTTEIELIHLDMGRWLTVVSVQLLKLLLYQNSASYWNDQIPIKTHCLMAAATLKGLSKKN